ncbi:hypothetical protein P1J78_21865 [Psychromarinibacter sp. C21-152]|uniref:Uncharacterized protein n=1 Tax=Psychromarinibacter sediminicola TaxID=3033385 RepID=A0AAE3TAL8_9RHOB|nr:hypothetical protein [Psychromarinibacter sediminicola]MDF0603382.1 hypothetical protein [Psychromarinibacter sediminicola]
MHSLDRKLLRDLVRLWAQVLAIVLVSAGDVVPMMLALGSCRENKDGV